MESVGQEVAREGRWPCGSALEITQSNFTTSCCWGSSISKSLSGSPWASRLLGAPDADRLLPRRREGWARERSLASSGRKKVRLPHTRPRETLGCTRVGLMSPVVGREGHQNL